MDEMKQSELKEEAKNMRKLMQTLESLRSPKTDLLINLDAHIGDLRDEYNSKAEDRKTLLALDEFASHEYLSEDIKTAEERVRIMLQEYELAKSNLERLAKEKEDFEGILDSIIARAVVHYDFLLRQVLDAVGADPEKFVFDGKLEQDLVEILALDHDISNPDVMIDVRVVLDPNKLSDTEIEALHQFGDGFQEWFLRMIRAGQVPHCSTRTSLSQISLINVSRRSSVVGFRLDRDAKLAD